MPAQLIERRPPPPIVPGFPSTARRGEQFSFPSVESGVKGYLQRMKAYPVFTPEQNAAALDALHSGLGVNALHSLTAFSGSHAARKDAYDLLIDSCPTLDMAIAFGNFPLITMWGKRYARGYPDLAPFPLEEYFQDALGKYVPDAARSYRPGRGKSFSSWVSTRLIWRLEDIVEIRTNDLYSLPEGSQPGAGRRAKNDPLRKMILNLDQPLQTESDDALLTLADVIVDPHENTEAQALSAFSTLRQLYRLARITDQQEEVITALFINGENVTELATRLQRTDRAIRYRSENGLSLLHAVGEETAKGVLSGELDLAPAGRNRESHNAPQKNTA